MRRVNEAWRVLGDGERRRLYDRELEGVVTAPPTGVRTADGVIRIDPRLLDPEFLAARRRAQAEAVEYKNSWMLRVLPMFALAVLLIGIVVFTAYARTPGESMTTTTYPGPEIGIDAGSCVRRLAGSGLLEVPCTGTEEGVLIGVAEPGGTCPAGTTLTQPVRDGLIACIG